MLWEDNITVPQRKKVGFIVLIFNLLFMIIYTVIRSTTVDLRHSNQPTSCQWNELSIGQKTIVFIYILFLGLTLIY